MFCASLWSSPFSLRLPRIVEFASATPSLGFYRTVRGVFSFSLFSFLFAFPGTHLSFLFRLFQQFLHLIHKKISNLELTFRRPSTPPRYFFFIPCDWGLCAKAKQRLCPHQVDILKCWPSQRHCAMIMQVSRTQPMGSSWSAVTHSVFKISVTIFPSHYVTVHQPEFRSPSHIYCQWN